MLPNLFIIGAPKCGTSALAHYLSEHENVYFSKPKEPFFLSFNEHEKRQHNFLNSLEDYLGLFSDADSAKHKIIAEGSTNYLSSEIAIEKALKLNPSAKFIVLLRDPVEVSQAFHMEQVFARNEDEKDFESAWRLQDLRRQGQKIPATCRVEQFLQYKDVALFSGQIERFFNLVAEENRLVLFQKDMRENTHGVYKQVLDFLGLPYDGRTKFEPVNVAHAHRYAWAANLVRRPPKFLEHTMFRFRRYLSSKNLRPVEAVKKWLKVESSREKLSSTFVNELRGEFRSDLHQLEMLIGRPLTEWQGSSCQNSQEGRTGQS